MGKEKTKAEIMEELRKKNEELEAKNAELEAKSAEVELIKQAQKTLAESYDKRVQELKEVKEENAKLTVDRDSFDKTAKKLFADKNELLFKVDTLKAEKQALNQRLRDAERSYDAVRHSANHFSDLYNELIGKSIFGFLKAKWEHKKK